MEPKVWDLTGCPVCGRTTNCPYLAGGDCLDMDDPRALEEDEVTCKHCGEAAGGTGSLSGLVHKWGPTDHEFEPTS